MDIHEDNKIVQRYLGRAGRFREEMIQGKRRLGKISWLRLAIFLVFGISALLSYPRSTFLAIAILAIGLVLFFIAVRWSAKVKAMHQRATELHAINLEELACLKLDFAGKPDGAEYLDPNHPYAIDLDLYGAQSLFQMVDRTVTTYGRQYLARRLEHALETTKIKAYQEAVESLSNDPEWRQEWQYLGRQTRDEGPGAESLINWVDTPDVLDQQGLKWMLRLMPPLMILSMACILTFLSWQWLLLLFCIPALILYRYSERVKTIQMATEKSLAFLQTYSALFHHFEALQTNAGALGALQKRIEPDDRHQVSRALRSLNYRVSQLNVRRNFFALILNILGLWEIQWARSIEKWKQEFRSYIGDWFDLMAELDYLQSIATLHFNHPQWVFPVVSEEARVRAEHIGHPLIHAAERTHNSLEMPARDKLFLVTGSNMSGKTTFLRTIGVNMVLAWMGAPVCASAMQLPRLQLHSSMRTQDALAEHTSSFYAELKRLKQILDDIESGTPCFVLLDEILKGTNSTDRHKGTRALLIQLLKLHAAGLVATHDLALTDLEEKTGGRVENWRFEVMISDREMHFDYQIRRGICQSFNATLLMEKMGFDI